MKRIYKTSIMFLVWIWYKLLQLFAKKKTEFANILVLDLMGIGDVVCLTPFLGTLVDSGKFSKITGCFSSVATDVSKSLIPLDDYIYHHNYRATIKAIRKAKFDLIIIPGWGLRHTILGLLSGSSLIGFLHDLSFTNKYINTFKLELFGVKSQSMPEPWADMATLHLSQRSNKILEFFSLPNVSNRLEYDYKHLQATQEDYAVFHCSAIFAGRQWDLQNFKQLAEKMIELNLISCVYLIGSKGDYAKYETISSAKIINEAGKMNLLQTQELLSRAKLFVGNDSGPMHIATFSKIPTYALMGPNLPIISGTISSLGYNFFHKQPCCPCNQTSCDYDYKCIKAISVDEVLTQILKDYKRIYEKA